MNASIQYLWGRTARVPAMYSSRTVTRFEGSFALIPVEVSGKQRSDRGAKPIRALETWKNTAVGTRHCNNKSQSIPCSNSQIDRPPLVL